MKIFTAILTIIVICLHVTIPVTSAPSSKNHHPTVYDQKQTGDYNIQLHLKDFQIIALLPGEAGLEVSNYFSLILLRFKTSESQYCLIYLYLFII